jgi:hypothetical protein
MLKLKETTEGFFLSSLNTMLLLTLLWPYVVYRRSYSLQIKEDGHGFYPDKETKDYATTLNSLKPQDPKLCISTLKIYGERRCRVSQIVNYWIL